MIPKTIILSLILCLASANGWLGCKHDSHEQPMPMTKWIGTWDVMDFDTAGNLIPTSDRFIFRPNGTFIKRSWSVFKEPRERVVAIRGVYLVYDNRCILKRWVGEPDTARHHDRYEGTWQRLNNILILSADPHFYNNPDRLGNRLYLGETVVFKLADLRSEIQLQK